MQNTEKYSMKNIIIHSTHPRKSSVVCVTCSNTKRKTGPLQRIPKGYMHNICHGAREEKQFDKDYAKKNMLYHTVTFDLQAVLHCECSNVSQVYYNRKLMVHFLYQLANVFTNGSMNIEQLVFKLLEVTLV